MDLNSEVAHTNPLGAPNAVTLTWENVNVWTKPVSSSFSLKKKPEVPAKHLLNNVNGIAKPGELVAIMGASGSGKTSLLNVLNFRNLKGLNVTGNVTVNGTQVTESVALASISAYVEQEELFIGTLTVNEHLRFQAALRMKRGTTYEDREKRVEEVMLELNLKKCENTLIGDVVKNIRGISGGEKRRLQFGTEILTNPGLLFCDEPTSGLDSYMAQSIVECMQGLARSGKTILCTIHQPSSELVCMFDKLCLIAEGRLAFLGSLDDAQVFFSSLGFDCPVNYNPLDFYISKLSIDVSNREKGEKMIKRICDEFSGNGSLAKLKNEIQITNSSLKSHVKTTNLNEKIQYKTGPFTQLYWLIWRELISKKRDPLATKVQIINTIMFAVIFGLIYLRLDITSDNIQNINGVIFLCITNTTFGNLFPVLQTFAAEIPIFLKENKLRMYRVLNYYLSRVLTELLLILVLPFLFMTIVYWMANLNNDIEKYVICAAVIVFVANVSVSFGGLLSSIASSPDIAIALSGGILSPLMIFGGSFLNNDSVPVYFIWLKYLSWLGYANEVLLVNQWDNIEQIQCPNSTVVINSTFASNSTCPFETGEAVLEFFKMKKSNFNLDLILLGVIYAFCRVMTLFFLQFRAYRNRK